MIAGVKLGARVGEGALAEVFRGTQRSLGRTVAVKVLKHSIAPDSQLGRKFVREGVLLSRMSHQSIVAAHDSGEAQNRPYIVLEFVEGETLAQVLERTGRLPVDTAVAIAYELASALTHAHAHNIVHRDVKPANVLLAKNGSVKLSDFGIARDLTEPQEPLGSVGTPAYMSPEQILGDKVDARADLFSLGILLYEMLTQRRPFEEETARSVMQKIRLDRFVAVSTLRAEVPSSIERLISRCLEKNPHNRYGSGSELMRDLADYLAARKVAATETLVAKLFAPGDTRGKAPVSPQTLLVRARTQAWWISQLSAFVLLGSLIAYSELTREQGADPSRAATGPRPPGTPDVGRVRVVARPWGQISIDGAIVDTAPTNEVYRLAAGLHYVRVTHPTLGSADRVIRVEKDSTLWLEIDLRRSNSTNGNSP
jgi:serine/threonine-protein kinase